MYDRNSIDQKESIDPEIQKRIDRGLYVSKEVVERPECYEVDYTERAIHYSLKHKHKYTQYFVKLKSPLGFLKSGKSDKS